jgi:hypothetical protein
VWGDGIIHVFERNKRVTWERVMCGEIVVDEIEAFYGKPRQMHRVRDVDRGVLKDLFQKKSSVLDDPSLTAPMPAMYPNRVADLVTVRESWHLPSSPGADDGAYFISVDGHALTKVEEWKHDFFPFARISWTPRLYGYWAQGLAEQLLGTQVEINKLLQLIQRSYHLGGTFKIFLERGSKIVKEHVNNEVGAIVDYTGKTPQYVIPPLVPPEIYTHLVRLIPQAYEQAGVSTLSATSRTPVGIESGKALRTLNDIESDRFLTTSRAYEEFYLELARLSIATARDIAEENDGSYPVKVPFQSELMDIDWKDIDLQEDDFVMQCYPVSSLRSDPAGRLQDVTELMQAGLVSKRRGRALLDFPDLQKEESLANASENYLQWVFDKMLEGDPDDPTTYTPPEPYDDLVTAREMALEYYAWIRTKTDVDPRRTEYLRDYLTQLDELQAAAAPPPPPAGAEGAPPMAVPGAPPVSELLPNVPMPPGLPA